MSKLILVLDVTDGIDEEEVVDYVNCDLLCKLEEDEKLITGWAWHFKEDIHQVRGVALVEL